VPGVDEIASLIAGGSRAILISDASIDLGPGSPDNRLLVLLIGEGSSAAGGRGGGFGERKVTRAAAFRLMKGVWSKTYETLDESKAAEFEIPYYVSRIPITLPDGTESMGYGVVEAGLVEQMLAKLGASSSS
jgi:hypothetical protein